LFFGYLLGSFPVEVARASEGYAFSVNATVLLSQEFIQALAENSRVSIGRQVFFVGQKATVEIVFSTGEAILKNEKFACQLRNQKNEILFVYQAKAENTEVSEFSFEIPTSAVGENIFSCQATDYPQPIELKQQTSIMIFPDMRSAFNFLITN